MVGQDCRAWERWDEASGQFPPVIVFAISEVRTGLHISLPSGVSLSTSHPASPGPSKVLGSGQVVSRGERGHVPAPGPVASEGGFVSPSGGGARAVPPRGWQPLSHIPWWVHAAIWWWYPCHPECYCSAPS